MNFLNMVGGGIMGGLTGGPFGAALGAIGGAMTNGTGVGTPTTATLNGALANGASAIGNTGMTAGETQFLQQNQQLQQQQLNFQLAEQTQADNFDNVTSEKSEIMRESNELRNVAMEQKKADDSITKEFIKSIA